VIDVGTNNILLLITISGTKPEIIYRASATSALGKDMQKGFLQKQAIERAKNILNDFISISKKYTDKIIIIGTSCSREAKNISVLSDWLKSKFNLKYNIISGEEEAYLNGLANISEFAKDEKLLFFDVGGGSTEFTLAENGEIKKTYSTQIGIRRYANKFGIDFLAMKEQLKQDLSVIPKDKLKHSILVGIGGTACSIAAMKYKLAEYDSNVVHRSFIKSDELEKMQAELSLLDEKQIAQKMPFDSKRAEIILIGLNIVKEIVDSFQGSGFFVSDRGLQFGVLRMNKEKLAKML
jgi:exopolyphosphatase/guanosine-5'-triphosphate,3'-diphosphate pyrophosphatase